MNSKEQGKQSTPNRAIESADFLSFNNSQNFIEFCPSNSSSPQRQWKQFNRNTYQKGWNHQNRRFSGNYRNHSYSNMEKPHNRTFNGPYDNHQRFSYNRSHNSNRSNNTFSRNDTTRSDGGRQIDIQKYLHPSFMEDPWEALEKDRTMNSESLCIDNEELNVSSSGSLEELPVET